MVHGDVRRVTPVDIDDVIDTLVRSHLDDAWEVWALPFADREERLDALFRADLKLVGLVCGEIWMTDDASAVAVWLMHDAHSLLADHDVTMLQNIERDAFGARHGAVEAVNQVIFRTMEATDASWRLAVVGTRPERQREGLGSAVLRPMLDRLDKARQVACLETSSAATVEFFQRVGFEVSEEVRDLPYAAPQRWVMRREPVFQRIDLPEVEAAGITLSV